MKRLLGLAVVAVMGAGLVGCIEPPDLSPSDDPDDSDDLEVEPDRDAGPARDARVDARIDSGRIVFPDSGPVPRGGPARPPPARLSALLSAETTPPPISGGTLAVSSDGMKVVAADPDRDNVYVVDPETAQFQTVALDKGSEPGRVVLDGKSRAHVALRNEESIVSIDLKTSKILLQTHVCSHPRGMAYDSQQNAILVACATGDLVTLSADTHAELSRVFVDRDLRDVLVSPSGERFVSRYRSAELIRLSAAGKVLARNAPFATRETRKSVPSLVGFDAGVAPSPGDAVRPPSAESAAPGADPFFGLASVTMSPTLAWKMVVGADGLPLMVHQQSQDDEVVIQQAGGYGGGGGGCDTITHPAVTQYDEKGVPETSWGLNQPGSIVDVARSPDGQWLAFAQPGAYLNQRGTLAVTSLGLTEEAKPSTTPRPDGGIDGFAPCGSSPEYGQDVQATAVTFDPDGKLYVFSREPAQLSLFERDATTHELKQTLALSLHTTSVRDTGHELFHADVGTGLSCTSCHGEALDDGHVWNFQNFGPRRTQNIRGGLLSTLPLHWEGDLPTFQNLVDEVMTRRMGGFGVQPMYADALAKWIDKTPAFKPGQALTPDNTAAAARGKALFESAEVACASCHTGAATTNNQTVDVGTGGLFQVPSLLGLALHAPFMHDGCAKTLTERFDPACGGEKHGNTAQLSEAQTQDLVSYLETL